MSYLLDIHVSTNKGRRTELERLHYVKRRKKWQLTDGVKWYALKHHGKPCSCWLCKRERYDRAKQKAEGLQELRS